MTGERAICPECNGDIRIGAVHDCQPPEALVACRRRIAELEREREAAYANLSAGLSWAIASGTEHPIEKAAAEALRLLSDRRLQLQRAAELEREVARLQDWHRARMEASDRNWKRIRRLQELGRAAERFWRLGGAEPWRDLRDALAVCREHGDFPGRGHDGQ